MNFLYFNLWLLAGVFPFILAYSIGFLSSAVILIPLAKVENAKIKIWVATISFLLIGAISIFFFSLWAAYVVSLVMQYADLPEVNYDWAYWIAGFIWNGTPVSWLSQKEMQTKTTLEEMNTLAKGSCLYQLLSVLAFVIFGFYPSFAKNIFGWLFSFPTYL